MGKFNYKSPLVTMFAFAFVFSCCIATLVVGVVMLHSKDYTSRAASEGGWTYTVSNGEAHITSYSEHTVITNNAMVIPDTLGGYPVKSIRRDAGLQLNGTINSLTLPSSLVTIGDYAFCGIRGMSSITIPSGVTSIGMYAFATQSYASAGGDSQTITSIIIPSSVIAISEGAFNGQSKLSTCQLPSGITGIAPYTFYGCDLSNFTIPSGITTIGEYAFAYSNIKSIAIPNTVTGIGESAFYNCYYATSLSISTSLNSIPLSAFGSCTALAGVTIPSNIVAIGSWAFSNCSSLNNVVIQSTGITIGANAFWGCSTLTNLTIPSASVTVNSSAFGSCTSLTTVTFQGSSVSIDEGAFSGLTNFARLNLPVGTNYIGRNAISGCTNLTVRINCNYAESANILFMEDWNPDSCPVQFNDGFATNPQAPNEGLNDGSVGGGGISEEDLEALLDSIDALADQITAIGTQLGELTTTITGQLQSLATQLGELDTTVDGFATQFTEILTKIAQLSTQISLLESGEGDNTELTEFMATINTTLSGILTRLEALETGGSGSGEEPDYTDLIDELMLQFEVLLAEKLAELNQGAVEIDYEELTEFINDLFDDFSLQFSGEIETLINAKFATLLDTISDLGNENSDLSDEIAGLKAQLQQILDKLNAGGGTQTADNKTNYTPLILISVGACGLLFLLISSLSIVVMRKTIMKKMAQ